MAQPLHLIFGGSGAVGSALARRLGGDEQTIYLIARDEQKLRRGVFAVDNAQYAVCDVRDPEAIGDTISRLTDGGVGIASLAYCVGSIVLRPVKRALPSEFLDAFALNALGAALVVQAAEPALRRARGAVVLFSTVAAGIGFPNHSVIAMAKGAVEALTRSLAADLAPEVRVNCVAPSLMRTPLAESLTANATIATSIAQMHAIPRLGEADDAAALAAFLLGPDATWITGQVIAVDGGRSTLRVRG